MKATSLPLLLCLAACNALDADRAGEGAAAWQLDSVPSASIGALEGDSVYQLFRVADVAELPDGSIAVANAGTSEVRVYDAAGRFLRGFGRGGEGPGEFRSLQLLAVRGDTLLTFDAMNARVSRFGPDGRHLADVTLRASSGVPRLVGVLADGTLIARVSHRGGAAEEFPEGFQRDSVLLLRFAPDGALRDTLAAFPGFERVIHLEGRSGNLTSVSIGSWDFYRSFHAAMDHQRVFAAANDSAVVRAFAADGAIDTIRWDDTPQPVDDAYVDAYAEERAARLDSAAQRTAAMAAIERAPRPDARPVFDRLLVDARGDLWVRRFPAPAATLAEWLVFAADGSLRATLQLPKARQLLEIGRDHSYALERDDFDVEHVRAYRIIR